MVLVRIWLAALATPMAMNAVAHDLWIEREDQGHVVHYGHRHSGHTGEDRVRYSPDFVVDALCLHATGTKSALAVPGAYPARLEGECAVLLVTASSGDWTTTVEGTRNLPPGGLAGVVRSWRSVESVKWLGQWSEAAVRPLGEGLELVPLTDPLALRRGDKLRVLATLRGQPQPGVTLAYAGEPRGVTGADGQLNVRLRAAGVQMISASIEESSHEPRVGKTIHATALQFEVPSR